MGHDRRKFGTSDLLVRSGLHRRGVGVNPYPQRFTDLLEHTDGPVLDCGSGGRSHPNVISFDLNDGEIRGDGARLPFRDSSFDLVMSQAVLEHVPEPQLHVDEMVRVLRPGGALYIEAAFLQPIHMAPFHYQGITIYGLLRLCDAVDAEGWGVVGSLADSWDWLSREMGATLVLGIEEVARMRQNFEKIDACLPVDCMLVVAPGVWLLGRKP